MMYKKLNNAFNSILFDQIPNDYYDKVQKE